MKKNKDKKMLIKILFFIILIFIYFSYRTILNDDFKVFDFLKNENYIDITDNFESNNELIKEIFADGMDTNDFKKVNSQKDNYITNKDNYIMLSYDFENKLHYYEIEDYLKKLNKSEIVNLELIGESHDKRNIYSIEIGKGSKTLLIDANIHAAESGNTLILLKYMIEIVNKYENKDEDIIEKLNNYKIAILPCINPDGYEIYNFGIDMIHNKNLWIYQNKDKVDFKNFKFNANGVDINRNMPTQNAGLYYTTKKFINNVALEKTTKNGIYFGGESLGSEPETKALMYFMLKHYKNTFNYINMHSQGRVIYQGKPNLNSKFNTKSYELAKYISSYNKYTIHGLNYEEVAEGNDGTATDFMAELANGFLFSTKTGRLSISEYGGKTTQKYDYGVVTLETIKTYTSNPIYFKNEYYECNYYEIFTNLLKTK